MHPFELALSIAAEETDIELRGSVAVAWSDFLLNPRRLRGSDFLMRWSQGVWSEERITQAINETTNYHALPYGPSGTAPDNDPRAFELYFERLEAAGLGKMKRPDLLIFRKSDVETIEAIVARLGGIRELPFTSETNADMQRLLSQAVIAVECENSLWQAAQMPNYKAELTPQRRLGGKLGLKKTAVLPTVILKEEDRAPLRSWQSAANVKIHIWHTFYDLAFGLSFDRTEELISDELIEPTIQVFQAPGGATTRKAIYKLYHHYAYALGAAQTEPTLLPDYIKDKNGHILPFVRFKGGSLKIADEALSVLDEISGRSGVDDE